jgi:DNA polymerase-3 subunit alpha
MLCVQTGSKIHDANRFKFDSATSFLSRARTKWARLFKDSPDVLKRTMEIAERCNLKLQKVDNPFPEFAVPQGHTIDSYFEQVCREGIEEAARHGGAPTGTARRSALDTARNTKRG